MFVIKRKYIHSVKQPTRNLHNILIIIMGGGVLWCRCMWHRDAAAAAPPGDGRAPFAPGVAGRVTMDAPASGYLGNHPQLTGFSINSATRLSRR